MLDLRIVVAIARVCHEANRAYCATLGDHSQPEWPYTPEWQRVSAIAGVAAALDNPDQTPELSHQGWLDQKHADGWVYGKVKDPVRKEHPCMVEYDALPAEQRTKDHLFLTIVRALAPE